MILVVTIFILSLKLIEVKKVNSINENYQELEVLDYEKDNTYYYLFNKITEKTEQGTYFIDGAYAEEYFNELSFLFYANPLKFCQQLTFLDEEIYSGIIYNTMYTFLLNEEDRIIEEGSAKEIIEALPVNENDEAYSNIINKFNESINFKVNN